MSRVRRAWQTGTSMTLNQETARDRAEVAPPSTNGGAPAGEDVPAGSVRGRRFRPGIGLIAIATWVVALPVGILGMRIVDPNPLRIEGVTAPLVLGALGGLVLLGVALRYRWEKFVGVVPGLYAACSGLVIATALNGTPYGYASQ